MIPITVFYQVINNQSGEVVVDECVTFKNYENVPKVLPIYIREKYFIDLTIHWISFYHWSCNPEDREFLEGKIQAKS